MTVSNLLSKNILRTTVIAATTSLIVTSMPAMSFANGYEPLVITTDDLYQPVRHRDNGYVGAQFDNMSLKELRLAQKRARNLANHLAERIEERKAARLARKKTRMERERLRHQPNNVEAAIVAGVLGLAAGAIITNSVKKNAHRSEVIQKPLSSIQSDNWVGSPAWLNYCRNKYRSFNSRTGKFLSYSGKYKLCR